MVVCIMTGNSILRACGDTKTPSISMAASRASSTPSSTLILIFGHGPIRALGNQGGAWATVYCDGEFAIPYIWKGDKHNVIQKELVSGSMPSRPVMLSSGREMLRIGVPAAGANMMTPLAAGIMTAIAARLRRRGSCCLRRGGQARTHGHLDRLSDVLITAPTNQPEFRRSQD